jgi:tetratricopeptide (TPR) repeat protein
MIFPSVSVCGVVWLEIARIQFHSRRYPAALRAVREALQASPTSVEAWHLAGVIFHQVQRYAAARRAYDRAVSLDPSNCVAWYSRGLVLEAIGDRGAAISSYGAVIAISAIYQDAQLRRDRLVRLQVSPSVSC